MKTQTTFFAVLLLSLTLISFQLQAQTKIIAHKSHSGKASTFSIFSTHNFGLGPHHVTVVDTVFRVSDSTFVEVLRWESDKRSWKNSITYTSENKNYYYERVYLDKSLEILEGEMPNTVFIGFEEEDQQQQQSKTKYFYPFHSNGNSNSKSKLDYFHLPQPRQNQNDKAPVKKN